jgi:hypothetical protein
MQEKRLKHDADLRLKEYRRRIREEKPGIELLENGEFDFAGYESSKATKFTEARIVNLGEKGLDTSGSDQELIDRENAYNVAYGKFFNSGAGEYSPAVSLAFGGDVSPGFWTPEDIVGLDNIIENTRVDYDDEQWSNYGPIAIQNLIGLNLIPENVAIDWSAGFPRISASDAHIVDSTIKGMKQGAMDNQNFLTTAEYTEYKNTEIGRDAAFANQLAGGTFTTQASNELASMKSNLAIQLGFRQDDSGNIIMNWSGKPVRWDKIIGTGGFIADSFEGLKGANKGKREQNVQTLYDNLQGIGADGKGFDLVLTRLDHLSKEDWDFLLSDLAAIGQKTLAENLRILTNQQAQIDKVVNITNDITQDPVTLDELLGLRSDLQTSGIYGNYQKIRNMHLQGFSSDKTIISPDGMEIANPMYNVELDVLESNTVSSLLSIYAELDKAGNTKLEDQLSEWIKLEESTFQLNKQSMSWRNR